ncbi:cytochrome b [Modicisalibacter radicis]|uniref:cytochrome b n=1 Tax=Halomonas sp. EAR18 TaxID=2518972 RepID=UPI00109D243D|nr:cytochrome bc complex cytochrome b subunit [Halomonas sp. EAR18]
MAAPERKGGRGGLLRWLDERLPARRLWRKHFSDYRVPRNLNGWYLFGSLATLVLFNQLLSGLWLTMRYTPTAEDAFDSVAAIMRDVDYGWLIRHLHSTGASALFVVLYLHMFRGLLYGSYRAPRELVWVFGMMLYLLMIAEAFTGYLLPWGQMSYWGAEVVISLFSTIPWVGGELAQWIRGDHVVSGVTLHRFFALHVVGLPIVIAGLVVLHLVALREVGSGNPDGVERVADKQGKPLDGIPFHPYYTLKDLVGVAVFLGIFCTVVFYFPQGGGYLLEPANTQPADPLHTPTHIRPAWYVTPFYAILRGVTFELFGLDARFWGATIMALAIAVLFVVPWLDRSPVRSMRFKGWPSRVMLGVSTGSFVALGVLGSLPATDLRPAWAQLATLVYFASFALMPIYTRYERCLPLPGGAR